MAYLHDRDAVGYERDSDLSFEDTLPSRNNLEWSDVLTISQTPAPKINNASVDLLANAVQQIDSPHEETISISGLFVCKLVSINDAVIQFVNLH